MKCSGCKVILGLLVLIAGVAILAADKRYERVGSKNGAPAALDAERIGKAAGARANTTADGVVRVDFDEPKVYFMHIGGQANAEKLATGVKRVWDAIKEVRAKQPEPAKRIPRDVSLVGKIDASVIEKILKMKSESQDGVVKVTIGREGVMHGVKLSGSIGLTTWAAFSGSDRFAAIDGDFIMAVEEVQPVLRALRKAGIHIVALHNHMVGEQPAFYFTHFWGKGSVEDLARGLQSVLEAQSNARRHKR